MAKPPDDTLDVGAASSDAEVPATVKPRTTRVEDIAAPEFEATKLHNGQVEFIILTRCVLIEELRTRLWPRLEVEHFASDSCGPLYARLRNLLSAGRDWPSLSALAVDPALPSVTRAQLGAYIAKLEAGRDSPTIRLGSGAVVSVSAVEDIEGHLYNILDALRITRSGSEKFIETIRTIADDGDFDPLTGPEMFARAATEVLGLNAKESVADALLHYGYGLTAKDDLKRTNDLNKVLSEERMCFPTGFQAFDERCGGFRPGEVILLGASSGSGKTAFSLSTMVNMSRAGIPVAMLQLEVTSEQVQQRLSANLANIDSEKIRLQQLTEKEKRRIRDAHEEFHEEVKNARSRFTIYGPSTAGISDCEMVFKSFPYKVWFIDYVNMMKTGDGKSGEDWGRLSDLVKDFKRMAKKYGIAIVLCVQVNIDKETGMIEIRYAKAMREHADIVLGWHLSKQAREDKAVWIHHLKARQYEPFDFMVRVELEYGRFVSMDPASVPNKDQRKLGKSIKRSIPPESGIENPDSGPMFQRKAKPMADLEVAESGKSGVESTAALLAAIRAEDDPYANMDEEYDD